MSEDAVAPSRALFADAMTPPRARGAPPARGRLRAAPEDFVVEELPALLPEGEGAHAWLRVRKRGANTEWVARALAEHAGVRPVEVGFAGLKDRDAVATQWFSVNLQQRVEPDWQALDAPGVDVLEVRRGRRKLRRGQLEGNRFTLQVRELDGDLDALAQRLETLPEGVPNYFGPQRFGRHGRNLEHAEAMFARRLRVRGRHLRGLYLSAARSALFNRVLAERLRQRCWERPLTGDVVLDGDDAAVVQETVDAAALDAVRDGRHRLTGPLWGRGRPLAGGEALSLETAALAGCEDWCEALEHAGLAQERRALKLLPLAPAFELDAMAGVLSLRFELPPGTYATALVREFVDTEARDREPAAAPA